MATELAVSAALPQMTIDSHQHFWRYDPARDAWITDPMSLLKRDFLPEELQRECDANGIDATIAVQADQSENETLFLLDLAEHSKRIAGVVGWVDLRSPRLERQVAILLSIQETLRIPPHRAGGARRPFLGRPRFHARDCPIARI